MMISSLHRRWQVLLSASRPELKSRHSIHSLKQRSRTYPLKTYFLKKGLALSLSINLGRLEENTTRPPGSLKLVISLL